jgi:hypothetical protein
MIIQRIVIVVELFFFASFVGRSYFSVIAHQTEKQTIIVT